GLLQSSIPATTSMLIHSLKGKTERAVGLSFGAAVMSGAIIFYTPFRVILLSNYFVWITAGSMLVLLFIYSKRRTSVISE
ncbi:MAG TPA: hypothetical protein VET23_09115, partial [Chitinophagaceae bacterium]|nr:hypothetical protein [Chitinophagaceae bacterium]